MKAFKRIASFLLCMCMVVSLLPLKQRAYAAEVIRRYELDTDGIDPGATYLIVNTGTAGDGNALRFYYSNLWSRDFRNQALTVKSEDGVTFIETGFTNEEDCLFQFTATGAGSITHGDYAMDLADSGYTSGTPDNTLTFTNVGNGQYRIHYTAWWTTYYLRYSNSDWARSSTSSTVYLYKLVEREISYDVTFNLNGATSGELPQGTEGLESGTEYTVPAPPTELRKDIGEDTWLFLCWNTKADGTGTEYKPGDKITVTEDVVLYADWYLQNKHTISMVTYLDDVKTDVDKFAGYDRQFFAQLEGGDGTYIPLNRTEEGTYSARVPDNGTYIVYAITETGEYSPVHGHKIVVYNRDGITECLHYSITYDAAGGTWAEGEAPAADKCHNGETVIASENIPTREGYQFLGWRDQDGNMCIPGHPVTESADRKLVLTAVWEDLVDITVTLVIDHKAESGGVNGEASRHDAIVYLLREENGVNLPVEERILNSGYVYDEVNETTTYTIVFKNMPQGIYSASSIQTYYVDSVTRSGNANEDQTVRIDSKYTPEERDLTFQVVVNMDNEAEKALKPIAVNVKVSFWGHKDGVLGWHIATRQEGDKLPSTLMIDANGRGTANFTIWPKRSGTDLPYEFRVEVTSFILPDGTIVPASGDLVTYRPNGSGLYEATVSVEGAGRVPTYPEGSDTTLPGAYFDGEQQMGIPTVTVEINPMTVTFDAGNGTVNGQQTIILENQYHYPAFHDFIPVPNDTDKVFAGWYDQNGNPAENLEGQLLAGDVTYIAHYSENITLSGTVAVDTVFEQDGETVEIYEADRVKKVVVVLQKKVGDIYNDIDAVTVSLVYREVDGKDHLYGIAPYEFTNLPNNGTEYRVHALVLNYEARYDNNQDQKFAEEEAVALVDTLAATGQVDIHLDFAPDTYQQMIEVDASQIQSELRPTGALVQILGRDLGDVHAFQVITQHTVPPYGVQIDLTSGNATGVGFEDVWNWHTNGTPYEYQMQISTMYGNNVIGAYTKEGTPYTNNSPFTVVYGPANNYLRQTSEGGAALKATLVPKEYPVYLDLNLGTDTETPVYGMEEYHIDDGTGEVRYAYMHTWSFSDVFTAYPYREGYVFMGWESPDTDEVYIEDGTIHVGSTLNHEITLKAIWEPLSSTDYTIRYVELNTDHVLKGDTIVSGAAQGSAVVAAEKVIAIEGYFYVGAVVNGTFIDKADNPVMTVTDDPVKNLMVIYYLPDGSDGYTEQVESNLTINKQAVLENNGTYTITMDTYTKDNPITTLIQQNTPMDIVLVLDQSGSLAENDYEYLDALQNAVDNFVESVADHGRHNEVDHRIAIVGYAGNETDGHSSDPVKATGGKETDSWINTGVFDSNGEFHLYNVNGFVYTELEDTTTMTADGIYYTKVYEEDGSEHYLLLRHHDEYRHLITEEQARVALLQGEKIYGYVYNEQDVGGFVELTRNSSGLWLYGNKQLYSRKEFFTYHTDVWTHRHNIDAREIHAYGVGAAYTPIDGHTGVYTRQETTSDSYQQSIYRDALIPVSVGAAGSGGTNPGLLKATHSLGADGATRASYGMEMANAILKETPVESGEDRVRLVVMFTDGEPGYLGFDKSSGDSYYQQAVTEANNAIAQAYISKNTYGAYVYTIGLYESAGVDATSDVAYYMNALSSNYPNAQSMDDIKAAVTYVTPEDGTALQANGKFFVYTNSNYYEVNYGYVRTSGNRYQYCWYYTRNNTNYAITTTTNPTVSGGRVGSYNIYVESGGYAATENSGYYATTESAVYLKEYFENVLRDITTKITTEIILEEDTILRDIMNQGLVLTDKTVIVAYTQQGNYDLDTGKITWAVDANGNPILDEKVRLALSSGNTTATDDVSGVTINVYNLTAQNPTNPDASDYHPHTVDVTGYNFAEWFISENKTTGYKLVVTISNVEARDDVQWGRSTATNNEQSGLWLPADENGNRELLLPFEQPTTIFVERAYVLDYAKPFELSGWYFDDEDGKIATPIHLDCDIASGMNWFDPANPNTSNAIGGEYGNTKYGNVQLVDGQVIYTPTAMQWDDYDQFYVFGNTWRKTVLAQDANENGNLWNKVTVIPANNVYYEDSFVTTESTTQNGFQGFTFTGQWSVIGTGDNNLETPEHQESETYGDVHGWTDSLGDDTQYTDGTAHIAGMSGTTGAKAEFTFTGTGVEVYTSTNNKSGMVVAILKRNIVTDDGREITQLHKSLVMDNLAMSDGENGYYHIPTVAFKKLPYGTYTLQLIATAADETCTGQMRYEYIIDGVRIHNPLGNEAAYHSDIVQDAYGLETNAVFTEIRDILLGAGDFNLDLPDGADNKMGAVFIDWIQDGQGNGNDTTGTGKPSYEVGTYEALGPKNEVYLAAGQAIVLKVSNENTYYVGMKSLTGAQLKVNVSGIDMEEPTSIEIAHTTDMYYRVNPVGNYIVIQNANTDGAILSLTNLRTTNLTKPAPNGGVLTVMKQEAEELMSEFSLYLDEKEKEEALNPQPSEPEENLPTAQEQAQANAVLAEALFTSVRQWLDTE